jgi:hypothetical protein
MEKLDSENFLSDEVISRFSVLQKRENSLEEKYKNFEDMSRPENYKHIIRAVKNSNKLHGF